MLESNPSRNSQLETHPNDEQGRRPSGRRPYHLDRLPHAFQNSSRDIAAKRHPSFLFPVGECAPPYMPDGAVR
jgi:hypothetical protein